MRANKNKKLRKAQLKKEGSASFWATGEWPVYFMVTLLFLLAFGLIALFSASHVSAYIESGDSYGYISRQAMYAAGGLTVMLFVACIDYHQFDWVVLPLYTVSVGLLVVVFFFCDPLNGAKRWLYWENSSISWFPTLQVSEIAKFAMILMTAHMLCLLHKKGKNSWHEMLIIIAFTGIVAGLLLIEPHISGAVIVCSIVFVMIAMSGIGIINWFVLIITGTALSGVVALLFAFEIITVSYLSDRLGNWTLVVADMDWQTKQSVYAIGSGGLFGLGFGNGVQKQMWLPEATNDFIFSVICEELGFVGAMAVVLLFTVFIIQAFYIAFQAPDLFGNLVGIGIATQISLQFAFNIGVVTSLLPNTGISLPFFSSGVTSLLMLLGEVGVLTSIARDTRAVKAQKAQQQAAQTAQEHAQKIEAKGRARGTQF